MGTRTLWISGTLRRNSESRNRPRASNPRKALFWVGFLLLWALYFVFVCFFFLVTLPSLNPSLWGLTRGSSCRRTYGTNGTNWQNAPSEIIKARWYLDEVKDKVAKSLRLLSNLLLKIVLLLEDWNEAYVMLISKKALWDIEEMQTWRHHAHARQTETNCNKEQS